MVHASADAAGSRRLVQRLARLLAAHPTWVLAHAQGYADLALEQARLVSAAWQRRLVLQLAAGACAGLGATLAGVALMLWAITAPAPAVPHSWLLVLVPLLPLVGAGALWHMANGVPHPDGLDSLRQQWSADVAMLDEASPA